ncbi:MAG: DsrE/DsrF/DrsH-like family protein [Blastocatellia bacterium]
MTIEQSNAAFSPAARQDQIGSKEAIPAAVAAELAELRREIEELRAQVPEDRAALVVFSGDLDRAIAAFIIATGAAVAGLETTMFFTFWGLSILKKKNGAAASKKDLMQKMFAVMTPGSSESLGVSKMNYFGVGAVMLRSMMKKNGVSSLEELVGLSRELGVRMIGCTMSMDVMGIDKDELFDGIDLGGVAAFMGEASRARVSLFI